jgi:hypothetical protein
MKYADLRADNARLTAALERIRSQCGKVCDDFELCRHRACQSSYEAWSIADAALKGGTPESLNAEALAAFRATTR